MAQGPASVIPENAPPGQQMAKISIKPDCCLNVCWAMQTSRALFIATDGNELLGNFAAVVYTSGTDERRIQSEPNVGQLGSVPCAFIDSHP
jgi:hypothetical protein